MTQQSDEDPRMEWGPGEWCAEVERLRGAIATHREWMARNREVAGTPTEGDERLWDALTSTGEEARDA